MTELTLGISPCPNDVFIFSGMLLDKIEAEGLHFRVDFQDVENLNRRAQQGDLDVIKISYANYIHCAENYDLLDCGGALGRGVGPLLLAHGATWDDTQEILVPGEYTTANFLLDFYLKRPVCKRYLPFDTLYEQLCHVPGAQGVVIHEKRFTYAQDGLTLIEDLGRYWEEQTGYAIPLGGIVARKSLGLNGTLEALIRRSLRWAYDNYDEAFALCQQYAQDLNADVVKAHIELYVNRFSEALGDEGRAAIRFFLDQQKG